MNRNQIIQNKYYKNFYCKFNCFDFAKSYLKITEILTLMNPSLQKYSISGCFRRFQLKHGLAVIFVRRRIWIITNNQINYSTYEAIYFTTTSQFEKTRRINGTNRITQPEVFCIKPALKKFAKFTSKHLRRSFFLVEIAGCWVFPYIFIENPWMVSSKRILMVICYY